MAKTKISKTRKTRKLRKLNKSNKMKGGMNRTESTYETREMSPYLGAEERHPYTHSYLQEGLENQYGYESNASNASNKTVPESTEARVFDEQSNIRNNNVSVQSLPHSVIDMDIKDLKLPIYTLPGNGPIRKINFYKDGIHVGYAAFTYMNPIFEIHTLYINENQRSAGYGKRILKFLIQYAFEQLDANEMQLNDQTNSRIFNPSQHRNKMYTKSKFVQMKSKNYNKWMSLKKYRYKKFKSTIFRYLRS